MKHGKQKDSEAWRTSNRDIEFRVTAVGLEGTWSACSVPGILLPVATFRRCAGSSRFFRRLLTPITAAINLDSWALPLTSYLRPSAGLIAYKVDIAPYPY